MDGSGSSTDFQVFAGKVDISVVGSGIDTDIDDFASIRRTGIRAYVAWSGRDADGVGLPTMPGRLGILDGL